MESYCSVWFSWSRKLTSFLVRSKWKDFEHLEKRKVLWRREFTWEKRGNSGYHSYYTLWWIDTKTLLDWLRFTTSPQRSMMHGWRMMLIGFFSEINWIKKISSYLKPLSTFCSHNKKSVAQPISIIPFTKCFKKVQIFLSQDEKNFNFVSV